MFVEPQLHVHICGVRITCIYMYVELALHMNYMCVETELQVC